MAKNIGVRELAYFIHQSGDLKEEFFSNREINIGTQIHQYIQSQFKEGDKKEYFIKQDISFNNKTYNLNGYIDGVLGFNSKNPILLEIKSTTEELDLITEEYHREHMAQLKIYGYLYCLLNNLENIHLRLMYVSVIDYSSKAFDSIINVNELEEFSLNALEEYIKFLTILETNEVKRQETIKSIKFPFKMERKGQRSLMASVYRALRDEEILYAIAPTGIGKTMATLFSSLKALEHNDKLFYLTAKGSGKNAPIDALKILERDGLNLKAIDIVAKKKICNKKALHCNPDECIFAKGYFDRLKTATIDILENNNIISEEVLREYSKKHKICAFEYSLYLSYYCDVIIADYNYVFDPVAHLIRYFSSDEVYHAKVLIDEAHNMIDRSKEMFSAEINEEDIRTLRKILTGLKPSIRTEANNVIEVISNYQDKMNEGSLYVDTKPDLKLDNKLRDLLIKCDSVFEDNKKFNDKDQALDIYYKILDFINTSEIFSDTHRLLAVSNNEEISISYYCLDASEFLLKTIREYIHGIVFFSATLSPIEYHANLLTKGEGKFLELESPFDNEKLDIIIDNKISTKYNDRGSSIDKILEYIEILTSTKKGNYIVFFPSYQYLKMVVDSLDDNPPYEKLIQKRNMNIEIQNEILETFRNDKDKSHVGFFVLGGVFSEGIDLIGDALNGVIIVGVGLPQINDFNNLLRDYFNQIYEEGFEYAYTYPGMTKVIQSVGRVIRTEDDKGVAILLDNRFETSKYQKLMPPHWTNKHYISNPQSLRKELDRFYNKNK